MSKDKVIVITGASSGIGEATARLLAQEGFRVFAGARRAPLAPLVPNLEFGVLDVTNDASVAGFIDWVLAEAGKIDVLINNAGVSLAGPVRYECFWPAADDTRRPPVQASPNSASQRLGRLTNPGCIRSKFS
ncbi:SDR family NAD(P)-dependent oxidoreductase [Asticcacaulis endophyticus]|uniref:SDR family NAD(P)-dependent oxidoreductase n=1 Tax=Asticcacaulis endophyticus TaxID=1395890 RepID=UPI001E5A5B57|nr:SDR family NAD(P)-dependent oxidoreductase [Asticcacaulis endophyticus]